MKKILVSLLVLTAVAGIALSDSFVVSIANNKSTAQSVTTQAKSGYIHSIYVDVTGTTTGTLSIVTPTGEVIYTNALSADTAIYPRYITCNSTGATLGAGTNDYARYLLSTEPLIFRLTETAAVTNTYNITVKISDK